VTFEAPYAGEQPVASLRGRTRLRLFGGTPWLSLGVLVVWVVAALVGPTLYGTDVSKIDLLHNLRPPCGFGACQGHLLGTDQFGRDMLARVVGGARVALIVAVASVAIAGAIGITLGVVAGYVGGFVDSVISRITDVALAFPVVLLALLFAVRYGPSLTNVVVIIVVLFWGRFTRVTRAETIVLKQLDFVE
jgi:peptide/nickel transport system permease protein